MSIYTGFLSSSLPDDYAYRTSTRPLRPTTMNTTNNFNKNTLDRALATISKKKKPRKNLKNVSLLRRKSSAPVKMSQAQELSKIVSHRVKGLEKSHRVFLSIWDQQFSGIEHKTESTGAKYQDRGGTKEYNAGHDIPYNFQSTTATGSPLVSSLVAFPYGDGKNYTPRKLSALVAIGAIDGTPEKECYLKYLSLSDVDKIRFANRVRRRLFDVDNTSIQANTSMRLDFAETTLVPFDQNHIVDKKIEYYVRILFNTISRLVICNKMTPNQAVRIQKKIEANVIKKLKNSLEKTSEKISKFISLFKELNSSTKISKNDLKTMAMKGKKYIAYLSTKSSKASKDAFVSQVEDFLVKNSLEQLDENFDPDNVSLNKSIIDLWYSELSKCIKVNVDFSTKVAHKDWISAAKLIFNHSALIKNPGILQKTKESNVMIKGLEKLKQRVDNIIRYSEKSLEGINGYRSKALNQSITKKISPSLSDIYNARFSVMNPLESKPALKNRKGTVKSKTQ